MIEIRKVWSIWGILIISCKDFGEAKYIQNFAKKHGINLKLVNDLEAVIESIEHKLNKSTSLYPIRRSSLIRIKIVSKNV